MPPKKAKGKGKAGKAKSKAAAASPAKDALPYGDVVNRKQMEVKVLEQKQRIAELRAENAQLKRQHDKSERDTHEFVAYFQKGKLSERRRRQQKEVQSSGAHCPLEEQLTERSRI